MGATGVNSDAVIGAVISSILTGGGLIGIAAIIRAVRGLRAGSLSNTGTVIKQLGDENERLARDRDRALVDLAEERRKRWSADERAAKYRLQLIEGNITPYDEAEHG